MISFGLLRPHDILHLQIKKTLIWSYDYRDTSYDEIAASALYKGQDESCYKKADEGRRGLFHLKDFSTFQLLVSCKLFLICFIKSAVSIFDDFHVFDVNISIC